MTFLTQNINLIGDEISWLKALREEGRSKFKLPTPKTEAWKYTKLRDFNAADFEIKPHTLEQNSITNFNEFDCYQISFVNGVLNPVLTNLPEGVEVVPLVELLIEGEGCQCASAEKTITDKKINKNINLDKYPFAALNSAFLQEGVYINIEKNTKLDKPLMLINHTQTADNILYNLHNIINLEEGSELDFVEFYTYQGDIKSLYCGNHVNEISIGKNATFNHYKLQAEAYYAYHIALNAVDVEKGAVYNAFCLQKGAKIGRNETIVRLNSQNATANVNAAYVMNGWATLDTTTNVEHLAPNTFSNQLVKGVVGGDARGVFYGKIHIAKDAVKTEGRQLHRSLLLSNTAEVDTKPELEIFADDVKCSHGAASGELDANQLFYMQSRGIELEEARQLLIDAYLDEVIETIKNENIRTWMKKYV